MSGQKEPTLQLRERLRRLNSWRVQGSVPVEHNNEAEYVIADDGSRWVMKRVAVTQAEQFLAEAISYQLGHLLRLPIPTGAYGGSGEGLAWFSACQSTVTHYSPRRLALTANLKSFGQVLTLDVWVINEDRHPGNILLVQGEVGYSPCFIDFGGAMVGYPGDFVMRTKYLPREAQFAARTVAPEMLIAGAYQALEEIKSLATSDIEGIVREACDIAGFSTDAGRLSQALLDRRNELPGLVRAFLARLGVNP